MKKYEFSGETKVIQTLSGDVVLHRIRAATNVAGVGVGDLGGWIEKEENLSHEGMAWVYGGARVYGGACVSGGACVFGGAKVSGNARVYGNAGVFGGAEVSGNARVYDGACVYGNAEVSGGAEVSGNARVYDCARVSGGAKVSGNARVYGNAGVFGGACVFGGAKVSGNARVYGNAGVYDGAEVFTAFHILVIGPIGSRNDFTTFYRDKDNDITVKCGCFNGKISSFLEKVRETHGDSRHAKAYVAAAELARQQIVLYP